uniref:Uncharacterized protein n=1 Tax=Onchocerca volvulus TaxID=6282 RepID=A0A8R1XN17_ONCVO
MLVNVDEHVETIDVIRRQRNFTANLNRNQNFFLSFDLIDDTDEITKYSCGIHRDISMTSKFSSLSRCLITAANRKDDDTAPKGTLAKRKITQQRKQQLRIDYIKKII